MDASRQLIGLSALSLLLASSPVGASPASPASPTRLELVDDDCQMMSTVLGHQGVMTTPASKSRVSCTRSADGFSCKFRLQDAKHAFLDGSSTTSVDLQIVAVDDDLGILILGSPPIFVNRVFVYKKASTFIWTTWGMLGTETKPGGVFQRQCAGSVRVQ